MRCTTIIMLLVFSAFKKNYNRKIYIFKVIKKISYILC